MANPTGKGGFQDRPEDINKSGRPTDAQSLGALIREIGYETVNKKDTRLVRAIRRKYDSKKNGDLNELLDRGWGPVKKEEQHSGELVIRIVRETSKPIPANATPGTGTNQE